MAASCGADAGYTVISETCLPSLAGRTTGRLTWVTSGCLATWSANWSSAWVSAWPELTVTSSSGPLKPGPNPEASRSNAWRVVVPTGSLPWSEEPSRREKKGRATRTMTTRATTAGRTGRSWTNTAHFGQKPLAAAPTTRGPLAARSFFWRRDSTRGPMKLRKAGSRVRAAIMVNDTPMAAETARP